MGPTAARTPESQTRLLAVRRGALVAALSASSASSDAPPSSGLRTVLSGPTVQGAVVSGKSQACLVLHLKIEINTTLTNAYTITLITTFSNNRIKINNQNHAVCSRRYQ